MVGSPLVAFPLVGGLKVTAIDNPAAKGPIMPPSLQASTSEASPQQCHETAMKDGLSSVLTELGAGQRERPIQGGQKHVTCQQLGKERTGSRQLS